MPFELGLGGTAWLAAVIFVAAVLWGQWRGNRG